MRSSNARSSMLSAPASIPPTTHTAFAAAFGLFTVNDPASCSCNPALSASRSNGTNPEADTRFGSSKTGRTLCDALTYEVSLARPVICVW